jgi:hypothetical protein
VVPCRCEVLNVMSGQVARDYANVHLEQARTDGIGRRVLRCPITGIEWIEDERSSTTAYADEAVVLRRSSR